MKRQSHNIENTLPAAYRSVAVRKGRNPLNARKFTTVAEIDRELAALKALHAAMPALKNAAASMERTTTSEEFSLVVAPEAVEQISNFIKGKEKDYLTIPNATLYRELTDYGSFPRQTEFANFAEMVGAYNNIIEALRTNTITEPTVKKSDALSSYEGMFRGPYTPNKYTAGTYAEALKKSIVKALNDTTATVEARVITAPALIEARGLLVEKAILDETAAKLNVVGAEKAELLTEFGLPVPAAKAPVKKTTHRRVAVRTTGSALNATSSVRRTPVAALTQS